MTKNEISLRYHKVNDKKRLQFIVESLNKNCSKGAKVLDVGCGNGIISNYLGEEGFTVLGIDISSKTIEKAKSNNRHSNVSFKTISAEELAAEGGKYEAIICSEVLEHLNTPEDLLEKLRKSLVKNGVLIITVPNGIGPRELLITRPMIQIRNYKTAWQVISSMKKFLGYSGTTVQSDADNLEHIQFFTYNAIKQLSKNSGFEITTFRNSNFIEEVFPFSFFSNRIQFLQKLDCKIADIVPSNFASGFLMEWKKIP